MGFFRREQDFGTIAAAGATTAGRGRLILALLLVVAAAVLGMIATRPPDAAPAWVAVRAVAAGQIVGPQDFAAQDVRLPNPAQLRTGPVAPGSTLTRSVAAGDVLLADAIATGGRVRAPQATLSLGGEPLPLGLEIGDRADVWTATGGTARRLMAGVTIVDLVPAEEAPLGEAAVAISFPPALTEAAVIAMSAEDVYVVRADA